MPGTPMREFRIYQKTLIGQLRSHIGRGPVIGRLAMGKTQAGQATWKMTDPRQGDKEMAFPAYQAYASGQFNAPAPAPTPAAPVYAPQGVPQAAPVAQAAPPAYVPPAPAQPVPQAAPAYGVPPVPGMMPAPPMGVYPQNTAAAVPVSAPVAPVPSAPPAPAPVADWTLGYPPPPGFGAEQWASFDAGQRAQLIALNGGPAAPAPAAA